MPQAPGWELWPRCAELEQDWYLFQQDKASRASTMQKIRKAQASTAAAARQDNSLPGDSAGIQEELGGAGRSEARISMDRRVRTVA